jgi:hypothetical protein
MTPDDLWMELAQFDSAGADRLWDGTAPTDDAPAWYGRVATLLRATPAPATAEELAAESEIVARMQAAILDPGSADESSGEFEIVARMQAVILESAWAADGDGVGDGDRPRHLRAPAPVLPGARLRQGARVVRRIVAVKAAAVTTVVAIGVTAAAATTGIVATVVVPALSSHESKDFVGREAQPAADGGSSTDSSGGSGDGDGRGTGHDSEVTWNPDEPIVCMLDLDCLDVMTKAAADPAAAAATPGVPPEVLLPAADSPAAESVVPETPTTTVPPATTTTEPPTTTTTEPPTTTTTEPPTTTTTEAPPPDPPPGQAAAPPPETMGASTGGTAVEAAELTPTG